MRTRTFLALLFLVAVGLAPDALGQGRRGGGRGRRGPRGQRTTAGVTGVFGPAKGLVGGTLPAAPPLGANLNAPGPVTAASKGATMAADEKRFLDLVAEIDKKLAESGRSRAKLASKSQPTVLTLPGGVEPGTQEWRNLQRPVFVGIDHDESGWLSYREMRDAIDVDRREFALYDRDHDGGVTSREFMLRYDELVERSGVFPLPRPRMEPTLDAPRTAEALRQAYDADTDGAFDLRELAEMVAEGNSDDPERDAAALLRAADADGDARLAGLELLELAHVQSYARVTPVAGRADGEVLAPKTFEELFGHVEERPASASNAELPPWIPGPVPHFRRLDLDGNGVISAEDLRRLQGSASVGTRTGAVLAALDLNEDGVIDAREFAAAFATPPRVRPQ
ncbi:MAG: hypothetical protein FJ294_10225 [Planctomycetes bacterium]|nr:hypothetical protein [Planctomycetota bacterium]